MAIFRLHINSEVEFVYHLRQLIWVADEGGNQRLQREDRQVSSLVSEQVSDAFSDYEQESSLRHGQIRVFEGRFHTCKWAISDWGAEWKSCHCYQRYQSVSVSSWFWVSLKFVCFLFIN